MTERRHTGPLQVQKPLYPEGRSVCHTVILHPPGGMAEGDTTKIDVTQGPDSKTVLTSPAAAKWYKSRDKFSSQEVRIRLGERAQLDWLPPENILFEHARADFRFQLELGQDASAIGWEAFVFGRRAMGESWDAGVLRINSQFIDINGLLWGERANFNAVSRIRNAAQGLGAVEETDLRSRIPARHGDARPTFCRRSFVARAAGAVRLLGSEGRG